MGLDKDPSFPRQTTPKFAGNWRALDKRWFSRLADSAIEQEVNAQLISVGGLVPLGLSVPGQGKRLHAAACATALDVVVSDEVVGCAPTLECAADHAVNAGVRSFIGAGRIRGKRLEEIEVDELVFQELVAEMTVNFPKRVRQPSATKRQT
jgi:hypothetical protein